MGMQYFTRNLVYFSVFTSKYRSCFSLTCFLTIPPYKCLLLFLSLTITPWTSLTASYPHYLVFLSLCVYKNGIAAFCTHFGYSFIFPQWGPYFETHCYPVDKEKNTLLGVWIDQWIFVLCILYTNMWWHKCLVRGTCVLTYINTVQALLS